jgi:phosphate:Na+ symporter
MVVQSSSATLGITISLAFQGVITYETAAALVLGENIGTTITALLASIGATTNARRAAYFHVLFNVIGVFWITLIFQYYIRGIEWMIAVDINQAVVQNGKEVFPNTTAAIAATHSVFNIANTLLFLPFGPMLVRLLNRIVPSKSFKEKPHLTDLDIRMVETPSLAIEQSRKEIVKMGDGCAKMLSWLGELCQQDDPDKKLADRLKQREQILDSMQDEIAHFVTNLLSGNVPHSVAEEAREQLRIADEYESASDYLANLDGFDRKLRRDGHRFTPQQLESLAELNQHVAEYVSAVNEAFIHNNANVLTKTSPLSKRLRSEIKMLRQRHLEELSDGVMAPAVSIAWLATLNAYARVRDHIRNIAETISGEK